MSSAHDHLQTDLSAYVGGDERLQWRLTNRNSGVVREGDDERTVEPARNLGAVAAVTDRRVLFLVGGADRGRDDASSIPHEEVVGVAAESDLLASQLVVTTAAGATWRFTARENRDLDDAVAYLDERVAGAVHVETEIEGAREHRDAAETAADDETAAKQYDEAIAAYRAAVDLLTAPAVEAEVDAADLREEIVATIQTAIDRNRSLAREERSHGNWAFGAGDEEAAHRHFSRALEAADRALELARECPPGDPEAVQREREDLVDRLDELDIRMAVDRAGESEA